MLSIRHFYSIQFTFDSIQFIFDERHTKLGVTSQKKMREIIF